MLSKEKMDRINFLARKKKSEGLSKKEEEEQKKLREEYIKVFRKSFKKQLDSIEIID